MRSWGYDRSEWERVGMHPLGRGFCIVVKQRGVLALNREGNLRGFIQFWESKTSGCINPDILISCVRVLLFLRKDPDVGRDDLPWLG